jgi:hypothetical protein
MRMRMVIAFAALLATAGVIGVGEGSTPTPVTVVCPPATSLVVARRFRQAAR